MRLIADQVTRSFGTRRVFGPVHLEAGPGRVVGVAGANGSGKTTLLKTLVGLIRPSSGTVLFTGVPEGDGAPLVPRDVPWLLGWAGPDLALYGELTAAENLGFFARVAGLKASRERIVAHLAGVGLDSERSLRVPTRALSTGQRQRLKLAYATLHEPPFLFLDEPGSNLDEAGRSVVAEVVARQKGRGAVVLASNDPRELALADETVSL